MSEDRSDSESSIGPVSGEPLHGYVNLPQNQGQSDPDLESEEVESNGNSLPPPLVAKKDRSRYEKFKYSVCTQFLLSGQMMTIN